MQLRDLLGRLLRALGLEDPMRELGSRSESIIGRSLASSGRRGKSGGRAALGTGPVLLRRSLPRRVERLRLRAPPRRVPGRPVRELHG